jgi:F-type H+-transporting ATPase subunit b
MDIFFTNTFFALVALVIFVAGMIYLRLPGRITKSLDERAERIAKELEDARQLREDAQALLASYQRKQREAEQEAKDIVEAAKHEAARIIEDTRADLATQLERRTKIAEEKIAQAESQAMAEVQAVAADTAVAAARQLIAEKIDASADAKLVDRDIDALAGKLN